MSRDTQNPYLRDLLSQPEALEHTRAGLAASPALLAAAARLRRGEFRQVILTGMGSSFHALHPLAVELTAAGVPAAMVETSELVHYMSGALETAALVVAVSQSGRSAETVRLVETVPSRACVIGVTNTPGSPLAARADATVLTHAGEEATVSCKTYLATLLALAWLGDVLAGRESQDLAPAAPAVSGYLEAWRRHVEEAREALGGVRHLFLAGRGASLATTGTGGLIVKEAAHFPAEGMSAAAFRHGPFEMLSPAVFLLVFAGAPRTGALNASLAADVIAAGGRAGLVSPRAVPGVFRIPEVPQRLQPIVEILPVQMFTLALAAMHDHVAGAFSLASKVTATE